MNLVLVLCPKLTWRSLRPQSDFQERHPALASLNSAKSLSNAPVVLWSDYIHKAAQGVTGLFGQAGQCRFAGTDLVLTKAWANITMGVGGAENKVLVDRLRDVLSERSLSIDCRLTRFAGLKALIAQLETGLEVLTTASATATKNAFKLNAFEGNEAHVRMVLDIILIHFCRRQKLSLELEKALPESAPFTGKADYLLCNDGRPVAIIEAKRCFGVTDSKEARHSLFIRAIAQSCAMLAGFRSEQDAGSLLAIVTDARGWMVVSLTSKNQPVLQLWPEGQAILEVTGPSELAHLLTCLARLLQKGARA